MSFCIFFVPSLLIYSNNPLPDRHFPALARLISPSHAYIRTSKPSLRIVVSPISHQLISTNTLNQPTIHIHRRLLRLLPHLPRSNAFRKKKTPPPSYSNPPSPLTHSLTHSARPLECTPCFTTLTPPPKEHSHLARAARPCASHQRQNAVGAWSAHEGSLFARRACIHHWVERGMQIHWERDAI